MFKFNYNCVHVVKMASCSTLLIIMSACYGMSPVCVVYTAQTGEGREREREKGEGGREKVSGSQESESELD